MTKRTRACFSVAAAALNKILIGATVAGIGLAAQASLAAEPRLIELTQTPCQFIESENGVDNGFTTTKKADCESINAKTGAERLSKAKILELKPGKYIFRVTNKNVSYPLGFWLRGASLIDRVRLPSVSSGGLTRGTTKDYVVELEEGEYVYSCPLNPTPNYLLTVKS